MTQDDTNEVDPPAAANQARSSLNPQALGLAAFWDGHPIWANPFTEQAARAWTTGWKAGLADLNVRSDLSLTPAAADEAGWRDTVSRFRP